MMTRRSLAEQLGSALLDPELTLPVLVLVLDQAQEAIQEVRLENLHSLAELLALHRLDIPEVLKNQGTDQ